MYIPYTQLCMYMGMIIKMYHMHTVCAHGMYVPYVHMLCPYKRLGLTV